MRFRAEAPNDRPRRTTGARGATGPIGAGGRGGGVSEPARRPPGRRPGPTETREEILAAARGLFAEKGYDGASLRAIARAADVDPALVHHYFGNKEGVFVAAMQFPVDPGELLPKILETPGEALGETLIRTFLYIWDDPERRAPILALLRSAMTNERAAVMMREFVTSALFARAAGLRDIPLINVQAAAGQLIGVMVLRHVLKVEPIASATTEELVALLAPAVQGHLG